MITDTNLSKTNGGTLVLELPELSIPKGQRFGLVGNNGAGKTTLVKEFCKLIGVKENVNSPTYTLINQYKCNSKIVVHIDLYRVNNLIEINELGLFDYLPLLTIPSASIISIILAALL